MEAKRTVVLAQGDFEPVTDVNYSRSGDGQMEGSGRVERECGVAKCEACRKAFKKCGAAILICGRFRPASGAEIFYIRGSVGDWSRNGR